MRQGSAPNCATREKRGGVALSSLCPAAMDDKSHELELKEQSVIGWARKPVAEATMAHGGTRDGTMKGRLSGNMFVRHLQKNETCCPRGKNQCQRLPWGRKSGRQWLGAPALSVCLGRTKTRPLRNRKARAWADRRGQTVPPSLTTTIRQMRTRRRHRCCLGPPALRPRVLRETLS